MHMSLNEWTISVDWSGPDFMSKNTVLVLYKDIQDRRVLGRLIRNGRRGGWRKVPKKYRQIVYGPVV